MGFEILIFCVGLTWAGTGYYNLCGTRCAGKEYISAVGAGTVYICEPGTHLYCDGISHVSLGHGIIPNPAQTGGINPGE